MNKTRISIDFNSEKVEALRMYLPNKGLDIESELEKTLTNLFEKHVPNQVREFISLKEERASKTKKKNGYSDRFEDPEDLNLPFDI